MKNYLISEAIGDIAGSAYEGKGHCIKDYNKVKLLGSRVRFSDEIVLTFACTDTLAAIAGHMVYAYYKQMPYALGYQAMKILPNWMWDLCKRFDEAVNAK